MSDLIKLADELEELTGDREFLYSTQPSPTSQTRYIFQHGRNYTSRTNAVEYLKLRIEQAKASKVIGRGA